MKEKRVHLLLHNAPYSAVYERDNQGLLLALNVLFGLQVREFWDDNYYPGNRNVDGGRPVLDPCYIPAQ